MIINIESFMDASGKATQAVLLEKKLAGLGYKVERIDYPQYQEWHSEFVKHYLNGDFGKDAEDVNCYTASLFYALDRYAHYKTYWKEKYENGTVIIMDRYTSSNVVHQVAKVKGENEKIKVAEWIYDLEYNKLGLPKPDIVIALDLDPLIGMQRIEARANKINGSMTKDLHESNKKYMIKSYHNGVWVAERFNWNKVKCNNGAYELTINEIHDNIMKIIEEKLHILEGAR